MSSGTPANTKRSKPKKRTGWRPPTTEDKPAGPPRPRKSANAMTAAHAVAGYQKAKNNVMRAVSSATRGSTNDAKRVAAMIALPGAFPVTRFSSAYNGTPTAVASPHAYYQVSNQTTLTDTTARIPAGTLVAAVTRNPLSAVWQFLPNPGYKDYVANFYYPVTDEQSSTGTHLSARISNNHASFSGSTYLFPSYRTDAYLSNSTYFHPHGFVNYPFTNEAGHTGFYIQATTNKSATLTFTLTNQPAGGYTAPAGLEIRVHEMSVRGASQMVTTGMFASTAISQTLTLTIPRSGYYFAEAIVTGACDFGLSTFSVEKCDLFGITPLPGFDVMTQEIDLIRVMGASLMITQHSSVLNKGGQVAMAQVTGISDIPKWLTTGPVTDVISVVSSTAGNSTLPFEHGMYGFMRLTSVDDLKSISPLLFSRNELTVSTPIGVSNPMVPTSGFLVAVATVNLDGAGYPGALAHLTVDFAVEFRTKSFWFQSLPPQVSSEDFDKGIHLTSTVQQFHENPLHLKELREQIWAGARHLASVSPTILSLMSTIFPGLKIPALASEVAGLFSRHAGR